MKFDAAPPFVRPRHVKFEGSYFEIGRMDGKYATQQHFENFQRSNYAANEKLRACIFENWLKIIDSLLTNATKQIVFRYWKREVCNHEQISSRLSRNTLYTRARARVTVRGWRSRKLDQRAATREIQRWLRAKRK